MHLDEVTPGALGRLIIHERPEEVAAALAVWLGGPQARATAAAWLRRTADELEHRTEDRLQAGA